ncbi:MAG: ABC transporter ATP-binding protein/permease [Lachnospiraceae bacterium]|nr:ABC transporter ATP-binding protein/permease [Lachnospiraceae bacterium]
MKKRMEKEGYSVWDNLIYLLQGIWESDKNLMALMVLETVSMVITPYIALYLPKIGVDLVAGQSPAGKAALVMGTLTVIIMFSQAAQNMASRGKNVRQDRLRSHYRVLLFEKTLDCDYVHVESAKWQDKYDEAKEMSVDWGPWSATTLMAEGAVKICGAVVSFVLYGSIIGTLNGWLLVMIVTLSAINFAALRAAQKYEMGRITERSVLQRRREYIKSCSSDIKFGKDIRLYGMGEWIRGYFKSYNNAHFRLRQAVQKRYFFAAFIESMTMLIRNGVAYLYFLWMSASGFITAGEFVLACSAVASFSALVTQTSDSVGQMMQAVPPLNRMRSYLNADDEPGPEPAAVPPLKGEKISLKFEDVVFTYEGRYRVLDHFDLRISAGEKIALVGVNGAGKTTIIKLLCGFYKPDSGRILINGTDISMFRKEDLYGLVAPVFQEATILPFTIAQNISMAEKEMDRGKIKECLIRAGLWEKVSQLPDGMDSMMMNLEADGGVNLSGGQQQKLLMARALYKGAPLLFFDEPTAALDPIAESETYEMFHKMTGEKTAIFISHRLASTRFCDRVVFLEKGSVKAEGSHEELLKICPEYEKMYRIQSHYYKQEGIG